MLPRLTVEGRLVADPELRFAPSGVAVCKFRLVASDRRKTDSGEWEDTKTLWLTCTAFKNLAENIAESLEKGDLVTVVGKLSTDEWTDQEGNKRSASALVADSVAASLQFRTIKHGEGKTSRTQAKSAPADDPWAAAGAGTADDEPPF